MKVSSGCSSFTRPQFSSRSRSPLAVALLLISVVLVASVSSARASVFAIANYPDLQQGVVLNGTITINETEGVVPLSELTGPNVFDVWATDAYSDESTHMTNLVLLDPSPGLSDPPIFSIVDTPGGVQNLVVTHMGEGFALVDSISSPTTYLDYNPDPSFGYSGFFQVPSSGGEGGGQFGFDNSASLDNGALLGTPIPEPTARTVWALLGLAGVACLRQRGAKA